MDRSLPGSSIHGILQARIMEWVAIPFFRGSSQPKDQTQVSCIADRFFTAQIIKHRFAFGAYIHGHVQPFATPWNVAHQALLSIGFSSQEYWVAIFYSRMSSQPRDWTHISCVSCIGRQILYHCTTWVAKTGSQFLLSVCADSCFLLLHCKLPKNLIA